MQLHQPTQMAILKRFGEWVGDISPGDLSDALDIADMDDFASDTDSDYTSYWRDWVSDSFCCLLVVRAERMEERLLRLPWTSLLDLNMSSTGISQLTRTRSREKLFFIFIARNPDFLYQPSPGQVLLPTWTRKNVATLWMLQDQLGHLYLFPEEGRVRARDHATNTASPHGVPHRRHLGLRHSPERKRRRTMFPALHPFAGLNPTNFL